MAEEGTPLVLCVLHQGKEHRLSLRVRPAQQTMASVADQVCVRVPPLRLVLPPRPAAWPGRCAACVGMPGHPQLAPAAPWHPCGHHQRTASSVPCWCPLPSSRSPTLPGARRGRAAAGAAHALHLRRPGAVPGGQRAEGAGLGGALRRQRRPRAPARARQAAERVGQAAPAAVAGG
jgi:hypothetical protein